MKHSSPIANLAGIQTMDRFSESHMRNMALFFNGHFLFQTGRKGGELSKVLSTELDFPGEFSVLSLRFAANVSIIPIGQTLTVQYD